MNKLIKEFKDFIFRGNVIDLAVGVIIGGAFQSIVTSLIDNIISPILGFFSVGGLNGLHITLWKANLYIGAFLMDIVNFVIMALIVFLIIKGINALKAKFIKEKETEELTRKCPYCQSEIDIKAVKCPHCTSDIRQ